MANELGVESKVTSAPALDKPKDLAGLLTTITERTVFFIDEIHRLKPAIEEMLYIAMEDYELDWIIGQGPFRPDHPDSRSSFYSGREPPPSRAVSQAPFIQGSV